MAKTTRENPESPTLIFITHHLWHAHIPLLRIYMLPRLPNNNPNFSKLQNNLNFKKQTEELENPRHSVESLRIHHVDQWWISTIVKSRNRNRLTDWLTDWYLRSQSKQLGATYAQVTCVYNQTQNSRSFQILARAHASFFHAQNSVFSTSLRIFRICERWSKDFKTSS